MKTKDRRMRQPIPNQQQQQLKRNIGIIAHVDAGKTTVSERVLLFTGKTHKSGNTHTGDTTLDYGDEERKHGITINSAATTVPWRNHAITIIDTPGHIDFNIEVKRSLRVLDGAVVVFDAVAGVEPQSETNWRLADEFGVPRICFVNKMDRMGADFARVCRMIEERLDARALPLQLPIGAEDTFQGVVDVLREEALVWDDPSGLSFGHLDVPSDLEQQATELRREIVEAACEHSEAAMDAFVAGEGVPLEHIIAGLRAGVLAGAFVPVLCGSAFKNKGVQPLLDAVVDLLPAPMDIPMPKVLRERADEFAALAFKIADEGPMGGLTFCRVYSGIVEAGSAVTNSANGKRERIGRIFEMHADKFVELDHAAAGDIIAIPGLKATETGNTLCALGRDIVLESIDIPEPVTSVAIEPAGKADSAKMSSALARLLRSDPTLHVHTHPESGQNVLSGMGELHLEIAREKLEAMGAPVNCGQPEVAYRETITVPAEVNHRRKKQTGGPGQFAQLTLVLEPLERGSGIEFESRVVGGVIPADYLAGVERGIRNATKAGVVGGHPVVDVKAIVTDGAAHSNDSSAVAFEVAAQEAFREAMQRGSPVLLQPVMKVEVTTPEEALGDVIGDLSRRRGLILGQSERPGSTAKIVEAQVPLAAMFGYIGDLRSLSSGRASFAMDFAHYAPVPN